MTEDMSEKGTLSVPLEAEERESEDGLRAKKKSVRHRVHRNRMTILESILKVALHGAKKTHIMYKANLSFDELQVYIARLIESGLLEQKMNEEEMKMMYFTTQKGRTLIEKMNELREIVDLDPLPMQGTKTE